jgi:hypothetical protein
MKNIRYHIQLEKQRTTISLDNIVSSLLSLKLGFKPGTSEAHVAVRHKLEEYIAHDRGRSGKLLGRYITEQAILDLVDNMLSKKYDDYLCKEGQ